MCALALGCLLLLLGGCAAHGVPAGDDLQAAIRRRDLFLAPAGPGPHPAVIMLHGCGGLGGRDRMWAERLREWGYLTLRVDSLGPRSLKRVCGGGILEPEARVPDALTALAHLRTRADVDPARIVLMGWSHGAMAALQTLAAAPDRPSEGFRAAVTYYPGCRGLRGWTTQTPVLMLLGQADDWTSAAPCNALAERQRRTGLDVTAVVYPGAYHGFDDPRLGSEKHRVSDALAGRGATMQYHPAAAEDSVGRVRAFLARQPGP
jgi:dienelactone hydrolase